MAGSTAEARTASTQKDKKVKATASSTRKRPKYPVNISAAAKRARELAGDALAPGPKQHVLVRKVLGDRDPIEASGMSATMLKKYAKREVTFARTADETKALRALGNEVGDPFTKGRSLAGVLIAYHEERQAAKKK